MYKNHLPETLPVNWMIAECDEANGYLEFLGFKDEFLVSVMESSYDNPSQPFHLSMSQLKGILSRYDFENLMWPEWFKTAQEAIASAIALMNWINQNWENFYPVTLEVLVSLGTEKQLPILRGYFEGELIIHNFSNETLIFRKVNLLRGLASYSESAIETICHFFESYNLKIEEVKGGLLTNEKFQLIEDLRPAVLDKLKINQLA
ncbi:hypothetical protein [Algoriphagus marinus]|uniref:hypothetical protein n=1 Tax=Algoriphagus marinus TaxID=1925762 RepID=UPI00094B8A5E|nr:hypothetical protein [Algoriphagus marinus]